MIAEELTTAIKGSEFIVKDTNAPDVFIPEEYTEEQNMIYGMCRDFLNQEIFPNLERIDALEEGLMPSLLDKAGELGLLGLSIPAQYGGMEMGFVSSQLVAEATGAGNAFAVAISAHCGIGTLPILYYGNEEQKAKYLPNLATGQWKGCYCLTEPNSGSDANSGRTKAVLSEDGKHYILNGQKMWITNAGFADVFTVFAKIDDDDTLSAFILDKSMEGIELSPEEKKMGIKGSSTRQIFFNNVKVPVGNMLGDRKGGFKIALNILNIGRVKLGASAIGASKVVIERAIQYANEREQFGKPIAQYGAIKSKLAEQAIRTYASESAIYRVCQNIEDRINTLIETGKEKSEATLEGIEQFASECAIMKVHGSEVLDYVVDEGVQIFGGMGYSAEAPMERSYRDSRINRIYEGTNEINRMVVVDIILKRATKGDIDFMSAAKNVAKDLMSIPDMNGHDSGTFTKEKQYVKNFKKSVLMVLGAAAKQLTTSLKDEQEILMNVADMIIETYVSESILLRVEKLSDLRGEDACITQIAMMRSYLYNANDKIAKAAKDALNAFAEGDELRVMLMGVKRFTKHEPFNVKNARRAIAGRLIGEGKYCF
ncbi:MAG TPA: acyl-CoA dehydrogenase [Bacteroidetes bacterium]|nr:acyl-CoA dehydrogenase [Bacteroidota bacterium]